MMRRQIPFKIAAVVCALISTNAFGQEPGEEGISDSEACDLYARYYVEGDVNVSRPCDDENYNYVMDPSSNCSKDVKEKTRAFRARCKGAAPSNVTARRVDPEPACLVSELGPGIPCSQSSDLTILVHNNCNRPVKIQICFEQSTGKQSCAASAYRVETGGNFSNHACQVTGKYWVRPMQ